MVVFTGLFSGSGNTVQHQVVFSSLSSAEVSFVLPCPQRPVARRLVRGSRETGGERATPVLRSPSGGERKALSVEAGSSV